MTILITSKAYLKLKSFVTLVDTEISGMAKSKIDEDNNVTIIDFILHHQEVSGGSTNINDESQAKHINELMKKGDDPSVWNIWWHSHCDMGVFWSTTDDNTIEEHTSQSYLISLVVNKKMEMKARLDIYPKDNSPFNKETIATFDIDDIEIIKTATELKHEEQYEKVLDKLNTDFEKQMDAIKAKYQPNDKTIIKNCQKEIDEKVQEKIYTHIRKQEYLPLNNYNPSFDKYNKSKKKWNWFDGYGYDNKYNYEQGHEDADFINHQHP